jgi:hypothetical protein
MAIIQHKRGTAVNWETVNPVLAVAEIGYDTTNQQIKIGDGATAWNDLEFIGVAAANVDYLEAFGNNAEASIPGIENETIIDTITTSEWRNVKYTISMSKISGGVNKFYSTELNLLIDSTGVSVSEYNSIDNDGEVGTISVSQSGGSINISVTPNLLVKPITVRFYRTGLKA